MTGDDDEVVVQLRQLDSDVDDALAAAAAPVELAGGLWANPWNGIWRVTVSPDGVEAVGRFVALTLAECRRWAELQTRAPDL